MCLLLKYCCSPGNNVILLRPRRDFADIWLNPFIALTSLSILATIKYGIFPGISLISANDAAIRIYLHKFGAFRNWNNVDFVYFCIYSKFQDSYCLFLVCIYVVVYLLITFFLFWYMPHSPMGLKSAAGHAETFFPIVRHSHFPGGHWIWWSIAKEHPMGIASNKNITRAGWGLDIMRAAHNMGYRVRCRS